MHSPFRNRNGFGRDTIPRKYLAKGNWKWKWTTNELEDDGFKQWHFHKQHNSIRGALLSEIHCKFDTLYLLL